MEFSDFAALKFMFLETGQRSLSETDNLPEFLKNENVRLMETLFVCILVFLVLPITFVTSSLVLWATLLYPGFHTSDNYLLFSLAIADLLQCTWCIPMYALSHIHSTRDMIMCNKYVCLTWFASMGISAGGSLNNLLFISIDRYIAIVWPLRYRAIITDERTTRFLIGAWIYIFLLAFSPILVGWNDYDPKIRSSVMRCYFYTILPTPQVLIVVLGTIGVCIGIPSVLYIHILFIVRNQRKALFRLHANQSNIAQFENQVVTVKITAALMFVFIFLWLPYLLIFPFKFYKVFSADKIEIMKYVAQLFYFCNGAIDAPIYAMGRHDYRVVYKLMLKTLPWNWKGELRMLYKKRLTEMYTCNLDSLSGKSRAPSSEKANESPFPVQLCISTLSSESEQLDARIFQSTYL